MPALSPCLLLLVVAECLGLPKSTQLYVMLPLDTVTPDGQLTDPTGLPQMLDQMKDAGVDGFMVDVWWGITEPSPQQYRFGAYKELIALAKQRGFGVQCVTSFHQCGGNAGDNCNILLPPFVYQAEGIWYRDAKGHDNREYVSLFADKVEVAGRTPLQMYSDWFKAFAAEFTEELGSTITTMMVGMGPCGELRYPSYRLSHWNFCGIGEFQAYDPHALASLKAAAAHAGHAREWSSPPNSSLVGNYNSYPQDTDFFTRGFKTDYGSFFLDWYSSALKGHAVELLSRARAAFGDKVELTGKVAGIHWWYGSESHAAEVTAGYYNTNLHNAYAELADVFKSVGASLDFTCMEMRNTEQPAQCLSRPEELVRQVLSVGHEKGVPISGENALKRYDNWAYDKMLSYRQELESITYLRLTHALLEPGNLARFERFVTRLHGQDQAQAQAEGAASGSGRRLRATSSPALGAAEEAVHWV